MATKQNVAAIARQAALQHQAGDSTWLKNGVLFDLDDGGYCARFVRQCHDSALGQGEWAWQYKAGTALAMEGLLRDAGLATSNPEPGDVVCINHNADGEVFSPGHIAIFLGNGEIGENTSSGSRGNPIQPGTKISPLSAVESRITGYYATLPDAVPTGYEPGDITIEVTGRGTCPGYLTDHAIVAAANLAQVLGESVDDLMPTHRAVAIGGYDPASVPAPLTAFPGYAPGPCMIGYDGRGWVAGWFTDHAIVSVAAIAPSMLRYAVTDDIVAHRKVILTVEGGG